MRGKQVLLGFDNDHKPLEQGPNKGFCPGPLAAWRMHEILTGLDISCLLLDQEKWMHGEEPINDLNDYLQLRGVDGLKAALKIVDVALRKISEVRRDRGHQLRALIGRQRGQHIGDLRVGRALGQVRRTGATQVPAQHQGNRQQRDHRDQAEQRRAQHRRAAGPGLRLAGVA